MEGCFSYVRTFIISISSFSFCFQIASNGLIVSLADFENDEDQACRKIRQETVLEISLCFKEVFCFSWLVQLVARILSFHSIGVVVSLNLPI